jgi:lipoate synthase
MAVPAISPTASARPARESPDIRIEVLTSRFPRQGAGGARAGGSWPESPPDVFNHNIETVPDLYRNVRPGADYAVVADLLKQFKARHPDIPTKSGIMLGLGETMEQVQATLRDLRAHDVEMVTIGQYLQPSPATIRFCATGRRTSSSRSKRSVKRSASAMSLPVRSFAPRITPTTCV